MSNEKKITKKDLNSVFWKIQTIPFSFNYEKLQTIGFAHCMIPILDRIYKD